MLHQLLQLKALRSMSPSSLGWGPHFAHVTHQEAAASAISSPFTLGARLLLAQAALPRRGVVVSRLDAGCDRVSTWTYRVICAPVEQRGVCTYTGARVHVHSKHVCVCAKEKEACVTLACTCGRVYIGTPSQVSTQQHSRKQPRKHERMHACLYVCVCQQAQCIGFEKKGLLEKGSFQKSPFSRDSREFRDFRESRDSSSEKTPFVMTPSSGPECMYLCICTYAPQSRQRGHIWGL